MKTLKNISAYQSIIFDCDGVILNSNHIKTQAFFNVTKKYGIDYATNLQEYHILKGGISRYEKFDYFFREILKRKSIKNDMDQILNNYSLNVKSQLLDCEVEQSLFKFRKISPDALWIVVSGGDQDELREVFDKRKLSKNFNGGIYGSPRNKYEIMDDLISSGKVPNKSLFIGDSEYDAKVASNFKLDFVFLSQWTDVHNWESKYKDCSFANIDELIESLHVIE